MLVTLEEEISNKGTIFDILITSTLTLYFIASS